jgi:hypothetical protein
METTLIVAMTMQRYRLDLVPGQTVKAQAKATLRPGVWMTPRHQHRYDPSVEEQECDEL